MYIFKKNIQTDACFLISLPTTCPVFRRFVPTASNFKFRKTIFVSAERKQERIKAKVHFAF